MEIHRRTRAASGASTDGRAPAAPPRRAHGPPKRRPRATTEGVLRRLALPLLLLLLAAGWHVWRGAAAPARGTGTGGPLRGDSDPAASPPSGAGTGDPAAAAAARAALARLRADFRARYGGAEAAAALLQRGLRTFEARGTDGAPTAAAALVLRAVARASAGASTSASPRPLVLAFGGYSVTVGRGNHYSQSYPFVLERLLQPVLALAPWGVRLEVRNAAIGGIPSFPYGWCLREFLGEDADLVSWDYGMNEGNGAAGLEVYVRQALRMTQSPPLFVLLDTKRPRLDLLQQYADAGALPGAIALGGREAVDKQLLALPEGERPPGLRQWDEWGAPKGSPGQSPWHPKKMEHELMGWMLAMHMLDALEAALDEMERNVEWRSDVLERERQSGDRFLPPPVTEVGQASVSMLHGHALPSDSSKWSMNQISCRTSFLPNQSGNLTSIVESGVTKDDEDMLQPRDNALFEGGWVMDVGQLERDTKVKVQRYGGLGYIDMKTALYGIPASGTLRLWLPYEGRGDGAPAPERDAGAARYFGAVVLCEVNEKRGDRECRMRSDLALRVGGAAVSPGGVTQVEEVASYLKKKICIRVEVPEAAKISIKEGDAHGAGVTVDVTVTGKGVSRENGACSISHVIWENQSL